MLERKVYGRLLEWKSGRHGCLLIDGMRHAGKTSVIRRFGEENYSGTAYIDLSQSPEMRSVFDGDPDADRIVGEMRLRDGSLPLEEGSTLLVLDEIQTCPRALAALGRLSADGRFDVVASATLLGAAPPPAPDAQTERIRMRPLDFEEFLWANGIRREDTDWLRGCVRDREPFGGSVVGRVGELCRDFILVGGMPAAVTALVDGNSYAGAQAAAGEALASAEADICAGCGPAARSRASACLGSVPAQLSQPNGKFMYSRIGAGGRASSGRYAEGLLRIGNAGCGIFCRAVRDVRAPLSASEDKSRFKLYMSDTGMLMHMLGRPAQTNVHTGRAGPGAVAAVECFVAGCLARCGIEPRYYASSRGAGKMELDFVAELGGGVAAIQPEPGRRDAARALERARRRFDARRIMLDGEDIHIDAAGVEHYPLFAAAFADEMRRRPAGGPGPLRSALRITVYI